MENEVLSSTFIATTPGKRDAQLPSRRTIGPVIGPDVLTRNVTNGGTGGGDTSSSAVAAIQSASPVHNQSSPTIPLSTPRLVGCLPSNICKADLDHIHPSKARHLYYHHNLFSVVHSTPKPFFHPLLRYPSITRGTLNHGTSPP